MSEPRKYVRAGELAQMLGVTVRTVRRWIASGAIPSDKVGGVRLVPISAVLRDQNLTFLDAVEVKDDASENAEFLRYSKGVGNTYPK